MKTTDELLKILDRAQSPEKYISENSDEFIDMPLHVYLSELTAEKGLKKPDIIKKSNLPAVYVYKIFSGERMPGRDKLLCLCLGMGLTLKETQLALRLAGHSQLYPKLRRDSIIIFAVNSGAEVMECNEALFDLGENVLE